jgi:hypothetical protein
MTFINTIDAKGQHLMQFEADAANQEDMVMEVFRRRRSGLAYFEVEADLPDMDLCSLKRALTCLTKHRQHKPAQLSKTTESVMGPKGKPCYRYKLIESNG